MPARHFFIPFQMRSVPGRTEHYFVADLELDVLATNGDFVRLPYVRFDTGASFTTIPSSYARHFGIPFTTRQSQKLKLTGTAGTGTGYLNDVTIRFPAIPDVQFRTTCIVNPTAPRPLLCLWDVVRNFHLSTTTPSSRSVTAHRDYPYGAFALLLKEKHSGDGVKRQR